MKFQLLIAWTVVFWSFMIVWSIIFNLPWNRIAWLTTTVGYLIGVLVILSLS